MTKATKIGLKALWLDVHLLTGGGFAPLLFRLVCLLLSPLFCSFSIVFVLVVVGGGDGGGVVIIIWGFIKDLLMAFGIS